MTFQKSYWILTLGLSSYGMTSLWYEYYVSLSVIGLG